eukprot:7241495-Pyramimonas_sp.AAC.2
MSCRRKSARGRRRQYSASHVSMHHVFEEISTWSRWVDFRSVIAQGCRIWQETSAGSEVSLQASLRYCVAMYTPPRNATAP